MHIHFTRMYKGKTFNIKLPILLGSKHINEIEQVNKRIFTRLRLCTGLNGSADLLMTGERTYGEGEFEAL